MSLMTLPRLRVARARAKAVRADVEPGPVTADPFVVRPPDPVQAQTPAGGGLLPSATTDRHPADESLGAGAVSVRDVRRVFGHGAARTVVLDGVDLTVRPGEFVCVLGASGCGKSTLLNLVAGLDRPDSGRVQVTGGQPALMFQESALFPWLTASANVELALRLRGVHGRARRRREALELLERVHLGTVADRRAHELSGGQRQRVAMARSLAQGASVLLMDEPFAPLDAITRDLLHAELVSLWEQTGISVLFVTHNVREAVRLGQRLILLSSRPGRIAQEWAIDLPQPGAIEDTAVGRVSREVTARLREEITRHAHA